MNTAGILAELEPLDHAARSRRMVELGRAAARDRGVSGVIDALGRGGVYERLLALQACYGSGDGAHAARALADPSRLLRRRALRLVALFAADDQVLAALRGARRGERLALLKHLRHRGRHGPADALMDELAGGDEALDLLPFASASAVARHLPRAAGRGGPDFWSRLARYQPDLAAGTLLERAEAATVVDDRLIREANAALPSLADTRPDRALGLVIALLRLVPLSRLELSVLTRRRPAEVADLLLGTDDQAAIRLDAGAHRLDDARLLRLLDRRPEVLADRHAWFRRSDPARRAAVFSARGLAWRDGEGRVEAETIALLPREAREREARHHVGLPALATRPAERFPYAALLPWEEARRALDPWIGHPEGDLRGRALAALVSAARFHRDRLAEVLALAEARRNEQDPVRLAILTALAELPPVAFGAGLLDPLGRVLRAALDAADLSHLTAAAAERLVVRLLPRHPAWGATWLVAIVRERGQVALHGLESRLTDADVRRIAPALAPVLKAWRTREREPQLLGLAQALGRRIGAFDALRDLLESIVRKTKNQWVAMQALGLLAEHDRPRFAALVPRLVAEDPSWVTQPTVYLYLHRRRQDLLTPFLGQKAYRGRFSTGKTRYVLPLADGFFRWTPAQQATFSATLEEVTRGGDPFRDTPAVIQALGQLAALPAIDPSGRLAELAADARLAVRDAALRALGRLDADQGVPALLDAMADDRARVAIYALRRALLGMPTPAAIGVLRAVPLGKVTVAKEVLRLLGELPGDEAHGLILEFDGRPLHRDVRVALLRALWGHLDRPGAWGPIERAAADPDPALLSGVVRIPADRLSDAARGRLAAVLGRLLDHPEPTVRLATLARCAEAPVADPGRRLLARSLAMAGSRLPDERAAAARVIVAASSAEDADLVARAVQVLRADRRALSGLVHALQAGAARDLRRLVPVVRAVLGALAADPMTASLRAALGTSALVGDELAGHLVGMADRGELHADALLAAAAALGTAATRPGAAGLDRLEEVLAASPDDRLRRLALAALVARAQAGPGWDEGRLGRLRAHRADPSPLVAAAAQFTRPAAEDAATGGDPAADELSRPGRPGRVE